MKKSIGRPMEYIIWVGKHEKRIIIPADIEAQGEKAIESFLEDELNTFRDNLDCGWKER